MKERFRQELETHLFEQGGTLGYVTDEETEGQSEGVTSQSPAVSRIKLVYSSWPSAVSSAPHPIQ